MRRAAFLALLAAVPIHVRAQDEAPGGGFTAPMPRASPAAGLPETLGDAVGSWTLSPTGGGPGCGLTLEGESGPNGRLLRLGAECRKLLPALNQAAGWLFADKGVRIVDHNIRPLIAFIPQQDGSGFVGTTESGKSYRLIPGEIGMAELTGAPRALPASPRQPPATVPNSIDPRPIPGSQPVLRSDLLSQGGDERPRSADTAVGQPSGLAPPPSVPGVYALDRFTGKDVCRIALDPKPAAEKPGSGPSSDTSRDLAPARLLPGCQDNGITVFDPVSWRFASGHITLKARRGHAINLVATSDGSWRRDPDVGVTFVLRRVQP